MHDEADFVNDLVAALNVAGHQVVAFADPIAAWDSLAAARQTEVLVTLVEFPPGKSNGVSLALMARAKRPDIQVIFIALANFAEENKEIGVFLPRLVAVPDVVKTVEMLLHSPRDGAGGWSERVGDWWR